MAQLKRDDRTQERIIGALKGLAGCIVSQLPGESDEEWEFRKEDASELAESILGSNSGPAVVADCKQTQCQAVPKRMLTNSTK